MNDTIFALATAPGRAAVAVVRLSGPAAGEALDRLTAGRRPAPRQAAVRRLKDVGGAELDQALVLWMPGPGSYTGEDCVELHLHGGRAVVGALGEALSDIGLRPAEAGEFTRRAFEHGKLDLTQAEAIADLVDAETEAQRRQALDQLEGALGRRYGAWRTTLVETLALLEAEIDFPDDDLPGRLAARTGPVITGLIADIDRALAGADRGERVREGFRVAVVGAPNAGKSSLFNRLVRREAAIVTPVAGTTRDVIEASFQLEGYRVWLSDTAGLRVTGEAIEAEGVRRARAAADAAAMRLWVVDGSVGGEAWREAADLLRPGDLLILNKADLPGGPSAASARAEADRLGLGVVELSAVTEAGIEELERRLTDRVVGDLSGADFPAVTRLRHRQRLTEARAHFERGLQGLELGPELAAEDLRLAARALERVAGRVDMEDVLDVVFASFCIGK